MIEVKNLTKEYESVTPLNNLSITINDGDVISLIGPSGVGKSTFIRCLNLLEKPSSGDIYLDGENIAAKGYDVKKARRKIGMVFQSFNLFNHLTVIENMMYAQMDLLKKNRQDAYDTGIKLLQRVGMADKAFSYPDELSGGQKQRAAIARTLCMDPDVILLDEPTSALDPAMVSEVQAVIRDLSKTGKTMLIVTHEMNFARAISTRIFYMDDGGIYEEGTPDEIFNHPKKEKTRRFIQSLKVFEADIDSKNYDFITFGVELDKYLTRNDVAPADKYKIRLAIEEIVQQILIPRYKEPKVHIVAEYSEQNKKSLVNISYAGEPFDINDTDNELSLTVLSKTVDKIIYNYNRDAEMPNYVQVNI